MFGTFARKRQKMLRIVDGINNKTKASKTKQGELVVEFMPVTCCQVVTIFRGFLEEEFLKARDRVQITSGVRIFDGLRPIPDFSTKMGLEPVQKTESGKRLAHCVEWMLMSVTEQIEDHVFVNAYADLCTELFHPTS